MNLFDLGYLLGGAALAPVWARKRRGGWGERLGRIEHMLPVGGGGAGEHRLEARATGGEKPRVVLHAVSVGEVAALRSLVPLLIEAGAAVVVSVTTDTGLARARALYGGGFGGRCAVVRTPMDFSWSVRRFLDTVRPDVLGLVELEVWPNLVRSCVRRGIPVGVINGRLSERSFRGYRRARWVVGPSFRRLGFAAVQDEAYAERFRAMGVPPERVTVAGSMKWDAAEVTRGGAAPARTREATALARVMGLDPDKPIVVAGSTGPGEEALLHDAVPDGVQLVCAPRKPERFDDAAGAMPGCVRRSRPTETGPERPTRFLLDSIGELSLLYAVADVVVVGRSFGGLYGSDPMEPAALGLAVLIGPSHSDFASVVGELEGDGGIAVVDRGGVGAAVARLLADPGERRAMGERARACVVRNQGASARHAGLLMGVAGRRAG